MSLKECYLNYNLTFANKYIKYTPMKIFIKTFTLFLIISSLFLTSCSNDDNKTDFGISTGNFFPLKTNNEWTYIIESQNLTNLIKIVGSETFDGTSYFEFTDNSEVYPYIVKHWFAKKGATYLLKTDDTTINQGGLNFTIQNYELPILKDDFQVNIIWSGSVSPKFSYSGNGQSGTLPLKVDYTGRNFFKGEVTLNNVVYPNVIKSRVNAVINANGQVSTSTEEYWFAENIGIIKLVTYNSDGTITEKNIYNYSLN